MTHRLILLRHGQSTWNLENLFTGWTDVGLTAQGEEEAREAGRLIVKEGLEPDILHTSVLVRAITHRGARLSRRWGCSTSRCVGPGVSTSVTTAPCRVSTRRRPPTQHGAEQVLLWRRSYDVPPPALDPDGRAPPRARPPV